jgi:hypothetical protein
MTHSSAEGDIGGVENGGWRGGCGVRVLRREVADACKPLPKVHSPQFVEHSGSIALQFLYHSLVCLLHVCT